MLTMHFLKEFTARHGKKVERVADGVWRAFATYSWPGNVRELRNLIESMVVVDSDGVLGLDDLTDDDGLKQASGHASSSGADFLIGRPLREVERYYMEKSLEMTSGNREEAARMLGIGERTLYRSIQDWKLQDKIKEAIDGAGGNLDKAAQALGITKDELDKKLKKLGQQTEDEQV
jgi:two-component system response regulator HydG